VALAADSAVTVGPDEDRKVFNTVNKVFALSLDDPVGIMAYQSAHIMGVPVETVVKEYRKTLSGTPFKTLEEYAEDFERFLKVDSSLFTNKDRDESLGDLVHDFADKFRRAVRSHLGDYRGWGHPDENEALTCLTLAVKEIEDSVYASDLLPGIGKDTRRKIQSGIKDDLDGLSKWLSSWLPATPDLIKRIRRLATEQLYREVGFGGYTGIVIAGFGSEDVYPKLRNFDFYCSNSNLHKVRQIEKNDVTISSNKIAQIVPFAQTDVMKSFVEGIDPVYPDAIERVLDSFFDAKAASYSKGSVRANLVNEVRKELTQALFTVLVGIRDEDFIDPMMTVVSSMPKEELAILAEAFVSLTALKRKANPTAETVGGPTDVAVISKGDGLVWIKRKHYFDPNLNPDFFVRHNKRKQL
jgi:hypothetical protein